MSLIFNPLTNWFSKQFFHHSSMAGYFEPVIQLFKPSWREGYYRAKVLSVTLIANKTVALELKTESRWPTHQAGQHIELTIDINGRLSTRVFTIASSPNQAMHEGVIRLVIKQQDAGLFTPFLSRLTVNAWVNISKPKGTFLLPQSNAVSLFAAGTGITPFIAMLHQALHEVAQPIHLFYYARPNAHLLVAELESLSNRLPNFTFTLLSRSIDGDVVKKLPDCHNTHWMVCGPNDFHKTIRDYALMHQQSLSSEHFSLVDLHSTGDEKAHFQVDHGGIKFSADNQQPLLAQFQANNINVPYGCGMGICHQCQCVKKKGVVRDIRTGKLSDYGEELIQLCVSQVVSDVEFKA
jgi:ferredoxin-NADP reductase